MPAIVAAAGCVYGMGAGKEETEHAENAGPVPVQVERMFVHVPDLADHELSIDP